MNILASGLTTRVERREKGGPSARGYEKITIQEHEDFDKATAYHSQVLAALTALRTQLDTVGHTYRPGVWFEVIGNPVGTEKSVNQAPLATSAKKTKIPAKPSPKRPKKAAPKGAATPRATSSKAATPSSKVSPKTVQKKSKTSAHQPVKPSPLSFETKAWASSDSSSGSDDSWPSVTRQVKKVKVAGAQVTGTATVPAASHKPEPSIKKVASSLSSANSLSTPASSKKLGTPHPRVSTDSSAQPLALHGASASKKMDPSNLPASIHSWTSKVQPEEPDQPASPPEADSFFRRDDSIQVQQEESENSPRASIAPSSQQETINAFKNNKRRHEVSPSSQRTSSAKESHRSQKPKHTTPTTLYPPAPGAGRIIANMPVNAHQIGFSLDGSSTTAQKIWETRYPDRVSQSSQPQVSTPLSSTAQPQQSANSPLSSANLDEDFKQCINHAFNCTIIPHPGAITAELDKLESTVGSLIDQYIEHKNSEMEGKDEEFAGLVQRAREFKGKLDDKNAEIEEHKETARSRLSQKNQKIKELNVEVNTLKKKLGQQAENSPSTNDSAMSAVPRASSSFSLYASGAPRGQARSSALSSTQQDTPRPPPKDIGLRRFFYGPPKPPGPIAYAKAYQIAWNKSQRDGTPPRREDCLSDEPKDAAQSMNSGLPGKKPSVFSRFQKKSLKSHKQNEDEDEDVEEDE
jgi:hypothetical protein